MNKFHVAGKQGDTAVGIAPWSAIFQISLDGTAHIGQLTAYLMVPTRQKMHFKKVVIVGTGQ